MELTHEEKIIALKGFQESMKKEAVANKIVAGAVPKIKSFFKSMVGKQKAGAPIKGTEGARAAGDYIYKNRGYFAGASGISGGAILGGNFMKD